MAVKKTKYNGKYWYERYDVDGYKKTIEKLEKRLSLFDQSHSDIFYKAEQLNIELAESKRQERFWSNKNDEKVEVIKKLENQVDKLINYFIE